MLTLSFREKVGWFKAAAVQCQQCFLRRERGLSLSKGRYVDVCRRPSPLARPSLRRLRVAAHLHERRYMLELAEL